MTAIALILALALGSLAAPLSTAAQPAGKIPTIGVLSPFSAPSPSLEAFRQSLRELGYIEGQNVAIEFRSAEGKPERLPDLAADLVRVKVHLIFTTWGTAAPLAAKRATSTIPIVMAAAGDPVAAGLVASLARPGGNVTGLSSLALELEAKRLELLKDLAPKVSRVAVLWHPDNPYSALAFKEQHAAAQVAGVKLQPVQVRDASDLESAFAAMTRARADALIVHAYIALLRDRALIARLAVKHRLPAVYPLRDFVDVGGLMSYGASVADISRRGAVYVDKILKGAKPGDLPVEQPTKFELVVNLKTAKALGLTIPHSVLLRADQVIE